jgi:DNA repair protein REV1
MEEISLQSLMRAHRYKDYSIKFYSTLLKFADDIEVTSVDEAMIDVSSAVSRLLQSTDHREESWDPAIDLAERIRDEIRRETSCEGIYLARAPVGNSRLSFHSSVVSIGVGENMLLARIATKTAKPAGSFHLTQAQALEHLAPLPLSVLPGFGHSTIEKIVSKWGTKTCGEVQEKSEMKETAALQKVLGPGTGIKLWNFVRGIDDRQFKAEEPKKTVSANINVRVRSEVKGYFLMVSFLAKVCHPLRQSGASPNVLLCACERSISAA